MDNQQSQVNIPMLGMDRDSHPSRIKENTYTFAKNISLEDSSGNGLPVVQNEPSNLLCQNFKESFTGLGDYRDYKVVGFRYNSSLGRTYFFFVNNNEADTVFYKTSVIGYINKHVVEFDSQDTIIDCECISVGVLDEPLENQVQESLCTFKIIAQDSCNKCLGFSLDNPIFERNIRFKNEQCGRRMYWTDRDEVPRYIDLDMIENPNWKENVYHHTGQVVCSEEINKEQVCFDCEKIKMIPDYDIPCITPTNISLGGNLKLGTYEFLIAYCDEAGNELSDYFSQQLPVNLFDYNDPIMGQAELDKVTNYAIELKVDSLDEDFHFFKVAVVQVTGVNGEESYFEEGIHPITDKTVLYTTDTNKKRITLNKLLIKRVRVKSVEQMIDSNGYLFMAGIKNKPVINIQPIVSLIGAFSKWTTVIAKEDFYKNGINAATSRSFMRDEVYPLSLSFGMSDGTESNDGILINRFATSNDLKTIGMEGSTGFEPNNLNVRSILKGKNACGGNERKYRWQFENTAVAKGFSSVHASCETSAEREAYIRTIIAEGDFLKKGYKSSCTVTDMSGTNVVRDLVLKVNRDSYQGFNDLEEFLNGKDENGLSNLTDYKNPGTSVFNDYFYQYLQESRYNDYHCSSVDSCNCNGELLVKETLVVDQLELDPDNPITYTYIPFTSMAAKPLPYIETLFMYNQRDADTSFNNKYVYKNYSQAAFRGFRKIGNEPTSPIPLKILADIEIRVEEGLTLPNVGTRTTLDITNDKKLFFTDYSAATIPDVASWYLDPVYLSSYTNDEKDDGDFNFRETWGIISVSQSYKPHIARNALWTSTKNISEFPFIQLSFKSSDETYGLDDNQNTLNGLNDFNNSVITVNTDVVTNRIGKVRVSIYPKDSAGGTALKTIFVPNDKDTFIDLRTELGISTGEYLIAIDTPTQRVRAFEANFHRNVWKSGLKPGVTETPPAMRIWGRLDNGVIVWYNINRGKSTGGGYVFGSTPPKQDDDVSGTTTKDDTTYTTTSIDYAFMIVQRGKEVDKLNFNIKSITVNKVEDYAYDCYFQDLDKKICDGEAYEEGEFAYWESTQEYPDNEDLFNSSKLVTENGRVTRQDLQQIVNKYKNDIDNDWDGTVYSNGETFMEVFEKNFSVGDEMLHPDKANFTCKPIRHFKFPSSEISPPIYTEKVLEWSKTYIFPMGIVIDPNIINIFLDLAVKTNLLTQKQRDSIVSFKLKRGDRTIEKSVLAKGLLSDMIKYKEEDDVSYTPNFPFNPLGPKELILQNGKPLAHQYRGKYNNMFAFNGPEVDYGLTLNPSEIYIDGYQFGDVETKVSQVEDHAKMVVLSDSAHQTALDLARVESTFEFVSLLAEMGIQAAQAMSGGGFLGFSGIAAGAVSAGLTAGVLAIRGVQQKNRTAELRLKWIEIFKNNGIGYNFAHYTASVADYNNYVNEFPENSKLRFIHSSPTLKEGNYNVGSAYNKGVIRINNVDREKSILINLGPSGQIDGLTYPQEFMEIDTTNQEPPEGSTLKSPYYNRAANIYATLKVWKPEQYGELGNIKWIDISGCNYLEKNVDKKVIFGGDTFISKYSYKRKFNYFQVSAMNQADFTPFKYSQYFNIVRPKYFINYESEEKSLGISLIPVTDSTYQLKDITESGNYLSGGKFFHYQYGIPYFFVESTINCWNRYAGTDPSEQFYPMVGNYIEWTQENNVSIRKPNIFKYNYSYSRSGLVKNGNFLPSNYNPKFYDCINNSPNGIMNSSPDNSEKQKVDPWLVYKNFDMHNFPTSNGKLINLINIESTQVLGVFENQYSLFNSIDTLKERVTPDTAEFGTGGIFAQRPIDSHKTDNGYGGTQHRASVSNEFGHFWADARRGQVHQVEPNGGNSIEITQGMRNWFKEHLPFKIMRGKIEGMTDLDLDNPFKNLGIAMGWDSRYKRVFLTKLDYIVKPAYVGKLEYVAREGKEEADVNLDFLGTNKYVKVKDIEGLEFSNQEVEFSNTTIFEPVHFTVGYSPLFKTWISYYDFTPAFYIGFDSHFSTGYNSGTGPMLWSHLLTNKSFGVFNGKKYPWKVEISGKEQYTQKMLTNVDYWIESIRYQNEYDYSVNTKLGLDNALIYNNTNSTGYMKLVPKEPNNRYQITQYPKVNPTGTEILVSYDEGKWSFNDFYNRVAGVDANVPLWKYDRNAIDKVANPRALTFNQRWVDRIRGDWFLIRFEGGSDTRYKQMFKWVDPKDNIVI